MVSCPLPTPFALITAGAGKSDATSSKCGLLLSMAMFAVTGNVAGSLLREQAEASKGKIRLNVVIFIIKTIDTGLRVFVYAKCSHGQRPVRKRAQATISRRRNPFQFLDNFDYWRTVAVDLWARILRSW